MSVAATEALPVEQVGIGTFAGRLGHAATGVHVALGSQAVMEEQRVLKLAQVFQEATERRKHRARPCEDQTRDDRRLHAAASRAGDLRRRADSHNSQLRGQHRPDAAMTADNVVTFGAGFHRACSCEPNRCQAVPPQRAIGTGNVLGNSKSHTTLRL